MAQAHSSVQSIDRVIDIIETLSTAPQGLSLSDLAAETGLHISTAHRLVAALAERGYACKDPGSGKYRLTLRLFEVGTRVSGALDLMTLSREYLDELANFSQEAVHLVQRDGNDVVYLYKSEPFQHLVRMASSVGCRNPMYCTGVGKSILAFLPSREVERIWQQTELQAYTDTTITDLESMNRELEGIRKRGYALDNEEHEAGVRCIAAPILSYDKQPIAAISISAPASRMDDETIEKISTRLLTATREISGLLGYKG